MRATMHSPHHHFHLPTAFLVGFTVIRTSCPSAVRNSISRPTEKLPARLRISADPTSPGLMVRSVVKVRVSNHGATHPSRRAFGAPQDEAEWVSNINQIKSTA